MRVFLHPQLRAAIPKSVQRDIRARIWTRFKSQAPRPSRRHEAAPPAPKDLSAATTRNSSPAGAAAKLSVRRGIEALSVLRHYILTELQGLRSAYWSTMAELAGPCSWVFCG